MKKLTLAVILLLTGILFLLPLATQGQMSREEMEEQRKKQEAELLAELEANIERLMPLYELGIEDNNYVIKKYHGSEKDITVPRSVGRFSITKIGPRAFAENTDIESITMGYNIQYIGDEAFAGCPSLRNVTVDVNTQTNVGDNILKDCTDVTITGSYVSNISVYARLNGIRFVDKQGAMIAGDYAYTADNGVNRIIKYLGRDENVIIPSELGGIKNPSLQSSTFSGNRNIKTITLPEHITRLEYKMFADCTNLTDIYIYGDISSAAGDIFSNSPNLTLHIFPDSWVAALAYKDKIPIEFLHHPNSFVAGDFLCIKDRWNESGVDIVEYLGNQRNVVIPETIRNMKVVTICGKGFSGSRVVSVTIPSSVELIDYPSFNNCPNLDSVIFDGSGNTFLRENAFYNTEFLTLYTKRGSNVEAQARYQGLDIEYIKTPGTVTAGDFDYVVTAKGTAAIVGYNGKEMEELVIPDNIDGMTVTAIYDEAFKGQVIRKYVLPETITSIGDYAFANSRVEEINLPAKLEYLGDWSFNRSSLKKIALPDDLYAVGSGAFMQCQSLTEVKFGKNLRFIYSEAFSVCTALTKIELPEELSIIGEKAFRYCINVTDIYIPDSVIEIGAEAFSEMTKVREIKVPSRLKLISVYMFYGCWALKEIIIPEGVTTVGYRAFMHSSGLEHISLPSTLNEVNPWAFENEDRYPFSRLTKLTIPEFIVDRYKTMIVPYCPRVNTIIIQPGITEIKTDTFFSMTQLRRIELPDTVTEIGSYAFAESGITSMVIPDSVIKIGRNAFQNCKGLRYIYIPATVADFGDNIFSGCENIVILTAKHSTELAEMATFNNVSLVCLDEHIDLSEYTLPGDIEKIWSVVRGML